MNTRKISSLLAMLMYIATTWAQTNVSNDQELRDAIADKANIKLTADIDLSNSTLSIESGLSVTIDLGGYTLNRRLTMRGDGGGQVITVREGATLNLSNGTLKGGWGGNAGGLSNESGTVNLTNVNITGCKGDDTGGGICNLGGTLTMTGGSITNNTCYDHGDPAGGGGLFNAEGATATLTNVTITGNEDMVCGGGGICNYGTLNLDGCTITGNKARTVGGGIWNINKNNFKMQGANIITDNFASGVDSNLFLKAHCLITLTSSITGSRIGVMLDVAPYWFVDGFATYHSGEDPNTFFTCDKPWVDSLAIIQPEPYVLHVGEVIMRRKNLEGKVPYIEHSWDSENHKVVATVKTLTEEIGFNDKPTSETQYKKLPSSPEIFLTLGTENSELHEYYVAEGDELNIYALDIEGPNVHIILRDSAWLHLKNDIGVEPGNTVYFHAQSTASYMGKLTAGSGIGGEIIDDGANIEIHGGNFDVQGNYSCAAIGGKYTTNGDITIYDGHIKATVGDDGGGAAGIGGGYECQDYGNITIYGGTIDATGSAGIGGGVGCLNGKLTIWDGAITAHGQGESAGIGCNQYAYDYGAGTITINGGVIRAYGDDYGAGIGGGDGVRGGTVIVNGGHVEAYGGTDAAGIGGGEGGNGGIVTISGGYVYAQGKSNGAGIGGGEDGNGADVTINGGTVIAKAGLDETGCRAIGPGKGSDDYGSLTIGDGLMVKSERMAVATERHDMCWYRTQVQVLPCTHNDGSYTIIDGNSHSVECTYCTTTTTAQPHDFGSYGECDCHLISLASDGDNSSVLEHWSGVADRTFILSGRTLVRNGNWNAITLPFTINDYKGTIFEGASVVDLDTKGWYDSSNKRYKEYAEGCHQTSFDDDGTLYLYFIYTGNIYAGRPYMVKWNSGSDIVNPVFSGIIIENVKDDVTSTDEKVGFIGNYCPVTLTGGDKSNLYIGPGNKLCWPTADETISSFSAYFHVDLGGQSQVSDIRTNIDLTTGVESVSGFKFQVSGSDWYDMFGRKLNSKPTQKGVYIYKGKKVVIE